MRTDKQMNSRVTLVSVKSLLVNFSIFAILSMFVLNVLRANAAEPSTVDELVLMNRILASKEMAVLGPYGHASMRSRANPNRFFIAGNVAAALVSAKDIVEVDLDGQSASGNRAGLIDERFIHSEIYKARPDVTAIAFAATPELIAFSVSAVPLPRGRSHVPVFDIRKSDGGKSGTVNSSTLGRALAQTLGKADSALLFGQGAVAVARSSRDLIPVALSLRTGAEQRLFELGLGGTLSALNFTRDKAIPEAGGGNLGPSGSVERIDRFGAFFNFLGARDMERLASSTPSPHPQSDKELIADLVIANRILVTPEMGVLTPDGLAHVSARSRANPNHFFIARDLAPGMVTTADIIETDLDTRPVNGARVAQYSERFIHAEIYRARPEVMAILHAHTPELKTFGQSTVKLRPVYARARFVGAGFPVYDLTQFTGGAPSPVSCTHCISTPELGRALAKQMGNAPVSLLLDHGIAMADSSLRGLVVNAYNLRVNARIQQMAVAMGGEVGYFDAALPVANAPSNQAALFPEWDYWKTLLLGATNLNAVPKPTVGLPLNIR
ncbi:MAG: class II aldolase/adducin family protein [Burkholderiales bacterium]